MTQDRSLLEQELEYQQQQLSQPEQPTHEVRGYMAALFNIACGYVPVGCIAEEGGKDRYIYLFPATVKSTKPRYYAARDMLDTLQQQALKAQREQVAARLKNAVIKLRLAPRDGAK